MFVQNVKRATTNIFVVGHFVQCFFSKKVVHKQYQKLVHIQKSSNPLKYEKDLIRLYDVVCLDSICSAKAKGTV